MSSSQAPNLDHTAYSLYGLIKRAQLNGKLFSAIMAVSPLYATITAPYRHSFISEHFLWHLVDDWPTFRKQEKVREFVQEVSANEDINAHLWTPALEYCLGKDPSTISTY